MTRTQRALARRWRSIALACWLVAISGAVLVVWARIDTADRRADGAAARTDRVTAEADRRGRAVSTLATDVRQLRAQVRGEGKTPVAPDPSEAVQDLPNRAEVPVPLPGEKGSPGAPGRSGRNGQDGDDGTPGEPGASGQDGAPGGPGRDGQPGASGAPGEKGDPGAQGERGETGVQGPQGERGEQGPPGPACPDGYSLQAPGWDPDALVCRRSGSPQPEPSPSAAAPPALVPDRRRL